MLRPPLSLHTAPQVLAAVLDLHLGGAAAVRCSAPALGRAGRVPGHRGRLPGGGQGALPGLPLGSQVGGGGALLRVLICPHVWQLVSEQGGGQGWGGEGVRAGVAVFCAAQRAPILCPSEPCMLVWYTALRTSPLSCPHIMPPLHNPAGMPQVAAHLRRPLPPPLRLRAHLQLRGLPRQRPHLQRRLPHCAPPQLAGKSGGGGAVRGGGHWGVGGGWPRCWVWSS